MFKDCLVELNLKKERICFDLVNFLRMEKVDRISELPEPILHCILSFLPFKQVAQTSVLSKRWEQAWRTYPILEFDRTVLTGDLCRRFLPVDDKLKEIQKKKKRLFKYLEAALLNRHCREMISIKKFTIDMDFVGDPKFESFVDRCICYAVGSDVKELSLEFGYRRNRWFKLPQIVLCAGSIELLKLKACMLELLPRSSIQLYSLKELFLSLVIVDDHMIANLVSGCPLIEHLGLHSCQGFKSLDLSGLSRLKQLKVTRNFSLQRLNVDALNIHLLAISWSSAPCEINVASCKDIKDLSLNGIFLKDEWLCQLISRLSLLEVLSIFDCSELRHVKISSPCLKELCLSNCRELVELNIDAPNLRVFTYWGRVVSFSLNTLALLKTELVLEYMSSDTQWFVKYTQFLAKFRSMSQVIHLRGTMGENITTRRRIQLPSPLSSIKHLSSKLDLNLRSRKNCKITKLVDDLLWISPHTKAVSIECGYSTKFSFEFQFSYKKQLIYEGEFASCCKSHPISCWKQCMEEVKLEIIIENNQKGKNIKSYILTGADILGQITALFVEVVYSGRSA
ncbi:hypothetical protein ACOSQ3_020520 [Xanthoceras sorbifolium]